MRGAKIGLRLCGALAGLSAAAAMAHFQTLIPEVSEVLDIEKPYALRMVFTHPMRNGPLMDMERPTGFGLIRPGAQVDLKGDLRAVNLHGTKTYGAEYQFDEPGDYIFHLSPAPYWESAEEAFIIHYTKVVVPVLGGGEDWDNLVGLPVEIRPLTRPYGLYAGNVFRGVVLKNGAPAPGATVEVEYLNETGDLAAPGDTHLTQVVKADAHGVFCFAVPKAGWWGFAALLEADEQMPSPDGGMADVELGGVIWVKFDDFCTGGE